MKRILCINKKIFLGLNLLIFILISGNYGNIYSIEDPFFPKDIYIVVGDKVNVRTEPKSNSKVIFQLKITDLVKLIKRSGVNYKNDNIEGEWVYVDTGKTKTIMKNETYKGWILDYYLAKGTQFNEVKEFYDCILEGYVGDYHVYYEFKKDGTYKQIYYDTYENEKRVKYKIYYGKLYKYRNVIIVKDIFGLDYFYINSNKICYYEGDICTEIK